MHKIPGQNFPLAVLKGLKEHLDDFFAFVDLYKSRQESLVALFQYHNLQKGCLEWVLKSVGEADMRVLLEALKNHAKDLGYTSKGGGRSDHVSFVLLKEGDFSPQEIKSLQEAIYQKTLEVLQN
ncbi:hypothetical protein [Helicobacter suis]|uniref:hypothetical protein n=1 Tax=Helicobacter suis TaxID=104628 RepID=UPI0022086556|nr:hypothetical protein [Helicobacter suis]BDR28333.1 hypothetical protein HSHS1_10940 [Helicobacter suis HS1]